MTGKSMGFVCDIEINLKEGRIDGIVLPGDRGFLKMFGKETSDYVIKWKHVKNYWRRCDTGRCPAHNRLDKDHKM